MTEVQVARHKREKDDKLRILITKTVRITKRQEKRIAELIQELDNINKRNRESELEFDEKIRHTALKRRLKRESELELGLDHLRKEEVEERREDAKTVPKFDRASSGEQDH